MIVEIKSLLVHDGLVLKAIISDKISNKLDLQDSQKFANIYFDK